jgi:hypothetical protein
MNSRDALAAREAEIAARSHTPWTCFHRAWSACVGQPGYDKAVWKAAEAQLVAAGHGPEKARQG